MLDTGFERLEKPYTFLNELISYLKSNFKNLKISC